MRQDGVHAGYWVRRRYEDLKGGEIALELYLYFFQASYKHAFVGMSIFLFSGYPRSHVHHEDFQGGET